MDRRYPKDFEGAPVRALPVRNLVLLPGTLVNVSIGRDRSKALVDSLEAGDLIVVATQRDAAVEEPTFDDLHPVATLARVHRKLHHPRVGMRLTLEGLERFELGAITQLDPWVEVEGQLLEQSEVDEEAHMLAQVLREEVEDFVDATGGDADNMLPGEDDPARLADRVAGALGLDHDDRVTLLQTTDGAERLRLLVRFIGQLKAHSELKSKIESEVRDELNKNHREAMLRKQLRAIQRELGQADDAGTPLERLRERLDDADLTPEAQKIADRELIRMESLEPGQAEYNVIEKYLDLIADLPWSKASETSDDLDHVADVLDQDHYGLDEVKQRILEHMAVLQLSGNPRGTILCLAGPPGVGKTSLGESIARATGREFVRIALGGVRDESEIRGHRRTYVGSLPGRIISALRKAGTKNPVMLLDEVDKLGKGWQGDPEAALLEVLDPEQNSTFADHYLELPFDLSKVLFICTANYLENISAPLRDRLEIIEVSGYTPEEKRHIARQHLIPKRLADHAIATETLTITEEALARVIEHFTREAGVRQLNREITKLCRALALEVVRAKDPAEIKLLVDEDEVETYLGKKKFFSEVAARTSEPGVATGLAWTPVGGDILFVETSQMPGKGSLQITGQIGDVMQESARAAMTYVRSHADRLGVDPTFLERQDVHIHVPAGAIPKDGPSAGVTMFTALTSLLSGRRVRHDTAMTGEATLRGRVLPVGGIKSKVLAAHRAGITRVILPKRNERDLDDLPDEIRQAIEVILVEDMIEVLQAALEPDAGEDVALAANDDADAHVAA